MCQESSLEFLRSVGQIAFIGNVQEAGRYSSASHIVCPVDPWTNPGDWKQPRLSIRKRKALV